MNKIKFLFVALIATLALASCSDDAPAKMLWEVAATPTENVKAAFDPGFYHQIQIISDGEGGEVTLKCTNYKSLTLTGANHGNDEYVDAVCNFTAKITGPGIVKIILDKMPDGFQEEKTFLHIEGTDGKGSNVTTIDITRQP